MSRQRTFIVAESQRMVAQAKSRASDIADVERLFSLFGKNKA
jgi:hypothetical protein